MVFLCETKHTITFVKKAIKNLHQDRWQVQELIGIKGGMLLAWFNRIDIKHLWMNDFCIEMRIECARENAEVWLIFVYRKTNSKKRQEQWNF